jgi:hypothetical protein
MNSRGIFSIVAASLLTASAVQASDVRLRTRPKNDAAPAVSQTQASELTLTLTPIEVRPIQDWVRIAGTLGLTGKLLTAHVSTVDAPRVRVGQRARVFSADSKSSMYQARITRIAKQAGRTVIEATLPGSSHDPGASYVLEIVVELGNFLSVPNEAIIEEGDRQVVYVQDGDSYLPRVIQTGLNGERYTQVLQGVSPGEHVVTTGSFFIDAEYKMKGGK